MIEKETQKILDSVTEGHRLERADAILLLESDSLASIGKAANAVTTKLHPEQYRTYNIDRNINYTNICSAVCDFCAFYRGPKDPEGYVLDRNILLKKIEETVAIGGDQILLQGGMHPTLPLEWYEELLRDIKLQYPEVNVHGFSP
ncbi:MAG: dehypoxanthine futalosine cyclase, partial [Pirellulales bacterium]|nr:dehypoxanthine futalosine cyclase [Pirellulales bacterium]